MMNKFIFLFFFSLLTGCSGLPEGVTPVTPFVVERYMGQWFEIARLDHSFERGLSQVTAKYALQDDGTVSVINRGYSVEKGQYRQAKGVAQFVGESDVGHLKVSFFGPFYGTYAVFGLDQGDYQYAFISGFNTDYLWLLSRTPEVSQEIKDHFIHEVIRLGVDPDRLIWVDQSKAVL